jgi:hypothetical protein
MLFACKFYGLLGEGAVTEHVFFVNPQGGFLFRFPWKRNALRIPSLEYFHTVVEIGRQEFVPNETRETVILVPGMMARWASFPEVDAACCARTVQRRAFWERVKHAIELVLEKIDEDCFCHP